MRSLRSYQLQFAAPCVGDTTFTVEYSKEPAPRSHRAASLEIMLPSGGGDVIFPREAA